MRCASAVLAIISANRHHSEGLIVASETRLKKEGSSTGHAWLKPGKYRDHRLQGPQGIYHRVMVQCRAHTRPHRSYQ